MEHGEQTLPQGAIGVSLVRMVVMSGTATMVIEGIMTSMATMMDTTAHHAVAETMITITKTIVLGTKNLEAVTKEPRRNLTGHPNLKPRVLPSYLMPDLECFMNLDRISSMIPKPSCIIAIRNGNIFSMMETRSQFRLRLLGRKGMGGVLVNSRVARLGLREGKG